MKELIYFLRHLNKVENATIKIKTNVKIPKKILNAKVEKQTETEVVLGKDYASEVNERKTEGTEYHSGKTWGHHLSTALIENKGKYYLQYFIDPKQKPRKTYFVNERLATEDELNTIKEWEFARNITRPVSNPQSECGITKDNEVIVRSVALENIIYLQVGDYDYNKFNDQKLVA